jgi:hypothetical protein
VYNKKKSPTIATKKGKMKRGQVQSTQKKQIQTQIKENEEVLKIKRILKRGCAQSTNKSKGKMKMHVENVQRNHL